MTEEELVKNASECTKKVHALIKQNPNFPHQFWSNAFIGYMVVNGKNHGYTSHEVREGIINLVDEYIKILEQKEKVL